MMETIIHYDCSIFVEVYKWGEVEEVKTGRRWFCSVVPSLTKELLGQENLDLSQENWMISKFSNEGKVWVHTPLGGALIGRMVGDEFGFYEKGKLLKCRVRRILV